MADYDAYKSAGGTYNFSKGPKSLYEPDATGDYITEGVVLNVPQTDEDDECGGTERIGLERIADAVARIELDVEDPVGGIGLLAKMLSLIGTSVQNPLTPGFYPLFNLNAPSLTLGNIQINVGTDKITIGSTAEFSSTTLKLNTNFTAIAAAAYTTLSHRTSSIKIADDGVSPSSREIILTAGSSGQGKVTLSTGGGSWEFQSSELTCPAGSNIVVSGGSINVGTVTATTVSGTTVSGTTVLGGTLSATTSITGASISVNTGAGTTFQIDGTNIGKFSTTFGAFSFNSDVIINGSISTLTGGPYDVGSTAKRFGTLYCKAVNISKTTTGALVTLSNTVAGTAISADSSNLDIGNEFGPFRTVYALSGEFTTDIHPSAATPGTTDIGQSLSYFRSLYIKSISVETTVLPKVTNTVDIGSSGVRFKDLYLTGAINAADLTLSGSATLTNGDLSTILGSINSGYDLTAANDINSLPWHDWSLSVTVTGWSPGITKVFYKLIGKRVFVDFFLYGSSASGTSIQMTLPYPLRSPVEYAIRFPIQITDAGVTSNTPGMSSATGGTNILFLYTNWNSGSWSTGGSPPVRGITGSIEYEKA